MKVIKIGGPVYRIGVGGGAASSTLVCIEDQLLKATNRSTFLTRWPISGTRRSR